MLTPKPLTKVGDIAASVQHAGLDGVLLTEAGRTAYLSATAAAIAASGLEICKIGRAHV